MMTIGGRPSLATSTNVRADSPRNTLHMILEGNPWQGSTSAHYMPGYAALLTDEQIVDVSAYLRVQVAGRPPWADAASLLATLRKETHEK
ncbi:Cytochrome c, mono-and diheme variants [Mycobacteroides abscessus subsp. abscessus]|nr:Cytochrome c, mono-and diheme variants [Mycobacteroides abscessus subsp. abscessus]